MSTDRQYQVYQIDFSAVASGKRIASTKRRVRWRFGFANMSALANGEIGTACRGEEHDATLIWSITSGKRLVLLDGQEVHYSHSRNGIFDYSWTMRGNHVLKVIAHASPPLSPTPGFRQYDFFVDGQSFFSFPKVYRLGLAPSDPRAPGARPSGAQPGQAERGERRAYNGGSSTGIASLEAPHNPDEEEAYLQEAIRQSLDDGPVAAAAPAGGDLLDFGGPPAPAALPPSTSDPFGGPGGPPAFAALPPSTSDPFGAGLKPPPPAALAASDPFSAPVANGYGYPSQPAAAPLPALPPSVPAPTSAQNPYGAPPPMQNPYAPAPVSQNAYAVPAPPPAPQAWAPPPPIATDNNPYGAPTHVPPSVTPQAQPTPSTLGFQSPQPDFGFSPMPPMQEAQAPAPPPFTEAPAPVDPALMTMNTLSGQDQGLIGSNPATASGSLADQAYAKLANMDTFTLSSKKDEPASNPFASSTSINDNRSLAAMQKSKPAHSKEVMKSYAPSAMVVSSNQTNYAGQYGMQVQQQPQYGQSQPGYPPMQPQQQQGGYTQPGYPPQPQQGYPPQQPPPQTYGQQPGQPPYGQQPSYGQPGGFYY